MMAVFGLRVRAAPTALTAISYPGVSSWLPLPYDTLAFRWVGRPVQV